MENTIVWGEKSSGIVRLLKAAKSPSLVALLYGALALAGAALGETWSPDCLSKNVEGSLLVIVLSVASGSSASISLKIVVAGLV